MPNQGGTLNTKLDISLREILSATIFAVYIKICAVSTSIALFIFGVEDYKIILIFMVYACGVLYYTLLLGVDISTAPRIIFLIVFLVLVPTPDFNKPAIRYSVWRPYYYDLIRAAKNEHKEFLVLDTMINNFLFGEWRLITVYDKSDNILLHSDERSKKWKEDASYYTASTEGCTLKISKLEEHIFNVETLC